MGYAQPQPFTPTISLHGLTINVFLHTRPIVRKVKFIACFKMKDKLMTQFLTDMDVITLHKLIQ